MIGTNICAFILYHLGLSYAWSFHGFKAMWEYSPPFYEKIIDDLENNRNCCFN